MLPKPDLTMNQVENPINNYCDSGHIAAEKVRISDSEIIDMRFFQVSGNGINKIVCEHCLIVANYKAQQIKKQKKLF
jgi:hypothetical protein